MGYESLIAHYSKHELAYSLRMFFIGIANHVHWECMLSFTGFLFRQHGQVDMYIKFKVINYALVTLATVANAKYMLKSQHVERIDVACKMFISSYLFWIVAYFLCRHQISMTIVCIGVVIQSFAMIYGQCAILGYFKCIPQELIPSYMLGKQLSDIVGVLARMSMQEFSIDAIRFYFLLGLMIYPQYTFFKWIESHRVQHKQFQNRFRVKTIKAAGTVRLEDADAILPQAPGLRDIMSPSAKIKYLERQPSRNFDAEDDFPGPYQVDDEDVDQAIRDYQKQELHVSLRRGGAVRAPPLTAVEELVEEEEGKERPPSRFKEKKLSLLSRPSQKANSQVQPLKFQTVEEFFPDGNQ